MEQLEHLGIKEQTEIVERDDMELIIYKRCIGPKYISIKLGI